MYPFIKEGDICRFVSCEAAAIRRGDIILFRTSDGGLVAHRFYRSQCTKGQLLYFFKGDTNLGYDEAVEERQIIGKLVWIHRKKLIIHVTGSAILMWSRIILSFPAVSRLLRIYLNRKERRSSMECPYDR